ncbi:MAG TPA: hypothetical protein VN703_01190 [Candidatus Sulfopaludibacter sp.]|nr:hypothetical protein [Candidatus Sulfopaludibacter sp.]
MLPKLVEDIVKSKNVRIDNMLADGAYDSNAAVFKSFAAENRILPCIKVRKNAKVNKKINNILEIYEIYVSEIRFTKMVER